MQASQMIHDLQTHTVLRALSAPQLARLLGHARELRVARGDVLFHQGDAAETFYVVREGGVQVGVPAINGPALEVQILGAGEVLGWSWLIAPFKWSFDGTALEDSALLAFDGKALLQECEKDPALGYAVMKIFAALMSQRLQAARLKMMENWAPAGWA